jgi:RNA polymerase sigma-70 factor (ECF subfamily)
MDDDASLPSHSIDVDPVDRVTLDEGVSMALLVVLERLTPPERAAFVLHDVFQFSFDAVASIVGRTPAACRQLASRARRRIESETAPTRFHPPADEHHRVAQEFIAACAGGDLASLMRLLDPDVVGDVDLGPSAPARGPLHGNRVVARNLLIYLGAAAGTTLVSQPVNGYPGALAFRDRQLVAIVIFKLRNDVIHDIHAVVDPRKVAFAGHQFEHHD